MKNILCAFVCMLTAWGASAQEFTAELQADARGERSVYRPADFYERLDRFDNQNPGDYPPARYWAMYARDKILSPSHARMLTDSLPKFDRFDSFGVRIYFDKEGRIVTAEFSVAGKAKRVATPQLIGEIYNNLLKERVVVRDDDYWPIFENGLDAEKLRLEKMYSGEYLKKNWEENRKENKSNELFVLDYNLLSAARMSGSGWGAERYEAWKKLKETKQ